MVEVMEKLSLNELIEKFGEDQLNDLAISSELTWREVMVLKTYCGYFFQNKFRIHDQQQLREILLKHRATAKLIVKFFHSLLEPNTKENAAQLEGQVKDYAAQLKDTAPDEAWALNKFLELINCTTRTNFYQKDKNGNPKDYFSIKLNTPIITESPLPRPHNGTLVYSKDMSGCHLRGGKIARGGIRWSEREDFRMEVLALMRAQKLKNTIIIPDGAKGGFILKNQKPNQSKEETLKAGIAAYQTLLRGLLDITDNQIDGKIVKPKDVVCRDGDFPYLVVAADRGTGDFSDIANAMAKEYNFWLGDAFASGGSKGYSHKKLAITSLGAWAAVREHFGALGIDPMQDTFTVTGIGSMAGDVCGNGLLLSRKMKLLAAFSSAWIFVDPNPDLEQAFAERERLFKLPDSNWIDYNPKLISKGGGVFSRKADQLELSEEMKKLFGLKDDKISPTDLIKAILKLDVDLLWNGGIGTYVKAEAETHEQIRDKTTDSVRINATELRCKVIGEGGNLGLTQAARVEYAAAGGRLNTDFIDNSGGVDCSDHEVNIKIALNSAIAANKITEDERVQLLESMTDSVVSAVIANSEAQNQILSFSTEDSIKSLPKYIELISILKDKAELDPAFECLPTEAELKARAQKGLGLYRPELAILLSYSKRAAYESLMQADDGSIQSLCTHLLLDYFPPAMHSRFKAEVLNHPLKKEICMTRLANNLIDRTGLHFFHTTQKATGCGPIAIAKAYLKDWSDPELEILWSQMAKVPDYKARLTKFSDANRAICGQILDILSHSAHGHSCSRC